ncbi:hypothetical protein SAMN05421823_107191 [Catalinimonas alkaloidigena]|uniref:Uncharacterized protein n=2 Tax=Catalinimonas alkaloidigena TaxID=1075417 RepID=A0A1G9LWM9_9BACT|nr:hypothetical protein SAMN05421823_107191 [Catalinimonas alkaloidigena]
MLPAAAQPPDRFYSAGLGFGLQLPRAQPSLFSRSLQLGYGWEYDPSYYLQTHLAMERATGRDRDAGLYTRATNYKLGGSAGINLTRIFSNTLYDAEDHVMFWYGTFYAGMVYSRITPTPTENFPGVQKRSIFYPELGPGGGVNIGLNERMEVYVLLHYLISVVRNPTGYYDASLDKDPVMHQFLLTATFRGLLGDPQQKDKRNWNRIRYRRHWKEFGDKRTKDR